MEANKMNGKASMSYVPTDSLSMKGSNRFAWEVERKNKWIAAVRRQTIDKKPWVPTKNSRICSVHFVGGEKSNDPRKTAYNPTLFPEIYKKKKSDSTRVQRLEARHQRKRKSDKERPEAPMPTETDRELSIGSDFGAPIKSEIGVRTDPDFEQSSQNEPNFVFCATDGNNILPQTLIVVNNPSNQQEAANDSSLMILGL